jgi:hypothetical protein
LDMLLCFSVFNSVDECVGCLHLDESHRQPDKVLICQLLDDCCKLW